MAKGIDLTGQRFGKLVVVELLPERTVCKTRVWLCRCDCGGSKGVRRSSLVTGMTKTCGCGAHPSKTDNVNWKGYGDISLDFFTTVKRNAKKRSIEFDISIEYLWDLYLKQKGKCALSGLSLLFGRVVKDRESRTVSVDRIDSTRGYVEGNVQWVHKKINIMKNVYSQEEFIILCRQIVNYTKSK
jgi:hypothetical protein